MRNIPEPHRHNDDDPDEGHTPARPGEPSEPTPIRDILAAEFAEYLARASASTDEPIDLDDPAPTAAPDPGPVRPNLRLVTTKPDPADDWDEPLTVADAVDAARTTRRRVVRTAAGGTAFVVAAGVVAGWGEPLIVTGPLAVYGAGWLGYLWWNAALRPTLGQVFAAGFGGMRTAFTVVLSTLAALAHGLIERVSSARSRHETTRTSPVTPSA
ncbi:hypothetical protein [Nocardia vulneris]|uniref:Transmembrane protein n=1 Tax=Nocardia vulneris TaxID=1141657 RepID=A0ABR4Z5E7_9NOCA|nr:hypothetical protein [Nocardia vulneris]KIA60556.1 hypothetical protein FG87_36170 [Nocardia vulneris]